MNLNTAPSANRIHIGIFGKRNAGKSSIINAITGQDLAIVSDIKGTTTDPVQKAMELLPLGPVVIIDTPGLDDDGDLGRLRIRKAYQVLNKTDIAVLVIDSSTGITPEDKKILESVRKKDIPYVIVLNKTDLSKEQLDENVLPAKTAAESIISVSAVTGQNIGELKELIARQVQSGTDKCRIVGDLISPEDFIVLVVPIDESAPKGRLILPQQQTIRDILETGAAAIVVKETELEKTLTDLGKKPSLVITDSQAFQQVAAIVPADIKLTSFSILFARYKGDLETLAKGAAALDKLKDGDIVLISEGCTHHRQCNDIGTVKLPAWLKRHTSKELTFEFTSGTEFPDDLSRYNCIIHCGGCMLNDREMNYRIQCAKDQDIPIVNYGIAIAHINGILERSLECISKPTCRYAATRTRVRRRCNDMPAAKPLQKI